MLSTERTNTLFRDHLYEDNTSMNQFLSQRILFCTDTFISYAQMLTCRGQDPPYIFKRISFEMFNFVGSTFRLMADNVFAAP